MLEASGWSAPQAGGNLVNHNTPTPLFFVSVDSKGLSDPVSSLFATLTGGFISVDSKNVTARIGSARRYVSTWQ